jgi:hypothetical protein
LQGQTAGSGVNRNLNIELHYARHDPWRFRLFRSDTLYGSGDDEDELGDDRTVECYYLQLQAAGDERWASSCAFLTLDDVDRFGREELGNTLRWFD